MSGVLSIPSSSSEFILCCGSTGTGKSSTIAKFLRRAGEINQERTITRGEGENPVTFQCQDYYCKFRNRKFAFIDTPGRKFDFKKNE